jgi:hypothetical protein
LNSTAENVKVWKKKVDDKCGLVLSAQRKKNPWYIDSGCSKHMTGDKSKFLTLSDSKSGNVTFGNDAPGKVKGKGIVSLSNGKRKAQDVLLVENLKHNLLSVSQVCDRGCEVVFTSKDCKIKSVDSGQLVAKGIRTENNVYVLKEEEEEECNLSKYDESWLWHRRLGHLNFDHIIKLKNNGAVKDLPKISKPYDSVCKSLSDRKAYSHSIQIEKLSFNRKTSSVSTYGSMWTIKERRYRKRKLLYAATQINPATNKQITAQNYCPPCQLGKLPSSRISMDILALRAQNLQQLSASRIKSQPGTLLLAHSKPTVHKIQQCTENRCSQQNTIVQRLSAHGKTLQRLSAHGQTQ